jgi:hypothetical protein
MANGTVSGLARLVNNAGVASTGSGDSGGPAVRWVNTEVVAAGGTIVGHTTASQTTCQGVSGRDCGSTAYVAPYYGWRNIFGVEVMPLP